MGPTYPWNKKPTPKSEPSFPGLTSRIGGNQDAKSQYEEIQADELIALSSIYGDDFEQVQTKSGAWKKSEPSFKIRIKSSDEDITINLNVVFTATYPKTPPLLSIDSDEDLREGTRYKLQNVLKNKPKEMVAEEQAMIMEIVDSLRDILEDAAQAKAAGMELPSLEEERALHEAAAATAAREMQEEEENRRQVENREEERVLQDMVQDELKRQRAKAKEAKRKSKPPGLGREFSLEDDMEEMKERIIFDQPITIVDDADNPRLFQAVTDKVIIRHGPVSDCFTVRPIMKGGPISILVLKQTGLKCLKSQIVALETDLEALKKASHRNVLKLLDFVVKKDAEAPVDEQWTISVLCEYANKGSLEEFLEIAGGLGVEKVRAWTIELLDGLMYLHDKGIVHQDIHASNILLFRSPVGDITAKIADAGFQRQLHDLIPGRAASAFAFAKSASWSPPENANSSKPSYTQKTDVWDFGVIFLQMIFGLTVLQKYASPERISETLNLSDSLDEIVRKFFKTDPKKRPRAFELSSCEFLATDAPIMRESSATALSRLDSTNSLMPAPPRQRHDSMNTSGGPFSRFKMDFVEEGKLGHGGFGEVFKVRKKLDGQFYAIKKISQKSTATLTEVLKEVRLLSQLSHPYVVRYYNTWTEEVPETSETDEETTTATETSGSIVSPLTNPNIDFGASTGGLDFISSTGYPAIEFGYESGDSGNEGLEDAIEEETESDDDSTSQSNNVIKGRQPGRELALKRTRSDSRFQRTTRTILYIQMEFCEKRTLRDLINRGLFKNVDEIWRLLRQLLEGLAHIHSLNVVHRDLKPENIFIDGAVNVRIGDFGLATSGQYSVPDKGKVGHGVHNMTTSIGTPSYVAPEVRSTIGTYNSKVDMYSLGIILFEMSYPPMGGMERARVLQALRQSQPVLPSDFNMKDKAVQADIILSLVNHNPKDRPTSAWLLQSGKLPVQMESETIQQTLAGLSDPSSPYYQKMMSTLFSRPTTQAKDFAWDMDGWVNSAPNDLIMQSMVKQQLTSIFRRHGALETPRTSLFPRSTHYGPDAVQLLEPSGTLVQLPYDLTLPHARTIAKHKPPVERSFTFGNVFRDKSGGQPLSFSEVDFDIVSDSLDLPLKEAEVLKVLDEIVMEIPALAATQMCFQINHSDLLGLIFDFCRIEIDLRPAVAVVLSKLNIQQWTWQKIRHELRSPLIGVSATSLDDLQRFDFRDTPSKAFQKLKTIFEGTDIFGRASSAIAHLNEVIDYAKKLDVQTKIFINPLSSLKDKFYSGGILFACIYDAKRRDIFAAGGRYDSLIREHRPKLGGQTEDRHGVGFCLAWERLATSMNRYMKSGAKAFLKKSDDEIRGIWTTRRCDVLVASFDPAVLRSTGLEILRSLWANDISAELARNARSPEDLLSKYRDDQHCWIIIIKQDSILKVKSMGRKDIQDTDIPISQLMPWLRGEIRERDQREGNHDKAKLIRNISHTDSNNTTNHSQDVRVHVAHTRSKKSNRHNIVEQAQGRAASLVNSFLDGPILAIETTDQVMDLIRETRLSDSDTWRKAIQSVPTAERRYLEEIHDLMKGMAHQNKEVTRNAFVYNFRTGTCIYYDLGA